MHVSRRLHLPLWAARVIVRWGAEGERGRGVGNVRPPRLSACAAQAAYAVTASTDKGATAIAALARAMASRQQMALVRFALLANAAPALGALVPVVAATAGGVRDHFVLLRIAFAQDYRAFTLPDHESQAKVRPSSTCLPCPSLRAAGPRGAVSTVSS